jgi:hypothetical protein
MEDFPGREETVVIRLSVVSMLIALAVLAAPVVSTFAQAPDLDPSANPGVPKSKSPAKGVSSRTSARPTTAEAGPELDRPSQADVIKGMLDRKRARAAGKQAARKAKLAYIERWQMKKAQMEMLAMMRQSEIELERARFQAAQMEAAQRQEAEASMVQLERALSNARAIQYQEDAEYMLARDDPEQYRQLVQARIDAYNAQQQAIQNLTQIAARVLQGQRSGSAGVSGGASGSRISSSSNSSQGGSTEQSVTPSNPGGGGTRTQPSPPPSRSTADEARDAQRATAQRYKP